MIYIIFTVAFYYMLQTA